MRRGVLLRSATPTFLDPDGVEVLVDALGIRTRVDLRTASEIDEHHNPHLAASGPEVVHLALRTGGLWAPDRTDPDPVARVSRFYLLYLQHTPDAFSSFVRLLLDPARTPTLLHCTAGKDRTGAMVAVVLSAVGVTDDAIVDDYARTAPAMPALFEQLESLEAYRRRLVRVPEESRLAEPATMRHFLDLVRSELGGARAYLLSTGLTEAELAELEARLLG